MKLRLFPLLLALLVFTCSLPALAVEEAVVEESQEPVTLETEADDKNIVVNVTVQSPAASAAAEPVQEVLDDTPRLVSSFRVVNDSSEPETSLGQVIVDLFGEYQPRTQTVTEILSDGSAVTHEEIVPGVAGLDWQWLSGVGLFSLFLYCVLRMIGGIFT